MEERQARWLGKLVRVRPSAPFHAGYKGILIELNKGIAVISISPSYFPDNEAISNLPEIRIAVCRKNIHLMPQLPE